MTTSKHRLRWYQYSLRSLFVLTVLVAIAGSWFAVKRQQVERQRAVVKAIEAAGGVVMYDWEWEIDSNDRPPGPAWLRAWLGDDFFAHVAVVHLNNTRAKDAVLANIGDISRLQMLDMVGTHVTDAGLQQLRPLKQLQLVVLLNTHVTDYGVKELQQALPNCMIAR